MSDKVTDAEIRKRIRECVKNGAISKESMDSAIKMLRSGCMIVITPTSVSARGKGKK